MNFKALVGFAGSKEKVQEYFSTLSPPKQNTAKAVCYGVGVIYIKQGKNTGFAQRARNVKNRYCSRRSSLVPAVDGVNKYKPLLSILIGTYGIP